MIITIDGPTASGKSTTAQLLARKLGFFYLNSGFLYRAFAYVLMHERGYTLDRLHNLDEHDIRVYLDPKRISYRCDEKGNPQVKFDESDITPYLKGSSNDQATSIISTNKKVREALLDVQRCIGVEHDLVVDGRDAGSVVFPQAEFKFYLTAPLEVRIHRWMNDQHIRGNMISFEHACKQLKMRDERDMTRAIAPLIIPQGAIIIDNGLYTLQETVDIMYEQIYAAKTHLK